MQSRSFGTQHWSEDPQVCCSYNWLRSCTKGINLTLRLIPRLDGTRHTWLYCQDINIFSFPLVRPLFHSTFEFHRNWKSCSWQRGTIMEQELLKTLAKRCKPFSTRKSILCGYAYLFSFCWQPEVPAAEYKAHIVKKLWSVYIMSVYKVISSYQRGISNFKIACKEIHIQVFSL
jgi:hypothetical protein